MISYPNIDPVAIDLGFISIYWYGISYVVGILTAWFLLKYRVRQSQLLLDNQQIGDLVFFVMLGIIIGGRLGSIIFYNFSYYLEHPLEIFYIHAYSSLFLLLIQTKNRHHFLENAYFY